MLKSIRNIIILLFVVLSIWGIFLGIGYNIIHSTINVLDKIVQNTNIVINNNKIEVLETYSFQAKYNQKRISLQRTLYVNEEDSEYKCKKPKNVKVYLNNKLLKDNRNAKMAEANYYLSNTGVEIQNIDVVKNSEYHIKINYEYSNADAIIEYTNLATLKLITDEYITENTDINGDDWLWYLDCDNVEGAIREKDGKIIIAENEESDKVAKMFYID